MHRQGKAEAAAMNWRSIRLWGPFLVISQVLSATANFLSGNAALAWVSITLAVIVLAVMVWWYSRYRQTSGTHDSPPTTHHSGPNP